MPDKLKWLWHVWKRPDASRAEWERRDENDGGHALARSSTLRARIETALCLPPGSVRVETVAADASQVTIRIIRIPRHARDIDTTGEHA